MRKSTRISSFGLPEVREPVKNFRTRFSLTSYVKRVQQLTDEQKSTIGEMGFGNLLLVPNHSLSKILLTELMERWSCDKQAFVFDSGEIEMSLLDVALILGLRVVGNPVVLKEDEPFLDLEEEYGATKVRRKVEMGSLETRLDSLGETVSEDFIRTFLLYTLGTFLSSNGKVDSRYLSFLRNLDDVCRFAWGAAVIEDLSRWLGKRKENNVQYVGGCLIFLQTWFYEHFDIARPHLQDHDLTFPRVCRWDHSKSHQRQRFTSRFKDLHDDQVIWTLQPTSGELQMEIIKEALGLLGDSKELQSAQNCSTSTSINVPSLTKKVLQLSISSKVQKEDEVNFENQVVEDTPTKSSTCDEVNREKEINHENLIAEDTPTSLSICDEVDREQINLENLIVEDTPSNLSISNGVCREQEFNAEKLIVEDTPTKLSFCDDDLRNKIVMLEEENVELKRKLSQAMEKNRLLQRQILLSTEFEEQKAELKKELDFIREENRNLRLSINSFVDRMDRHVLDFETNAIE